MVSERGARDAVLGGGQAEPVRDRNLKMVRRSASSLSVSQVQPAYVQVAEQLRDLIMTGELQPGERLPTEVELAALFGVSRASVREGLRLLMAEQQLVTVRGTKGGTFVVTPETDHISRLLEMNLGLLTGTDRLSIAELVESRILLETPASGLAARRHTDAQLESMRAALVVPSSRDPRMDHARFHVAILRASSNRMLEVVTKPIFDVMRTRLERDAAPAGFWEQVVIHHRQILAALEKRDERAAERTMYAHLEELASVYTSIDVAYHRDRATAEIADCDGGRKNREL